LLDAPCLAIPQWSHSQNSCGGLLRPNGQELLIIFHDLEGALGWARRMGREDEREEVALAGQGLGPAVSTPTPCGPMAEQCCPARFPHLFPPCCGMPSSHRPNPASSHPPNPASERDIRRPWPTGCLLLCCARKGLSSLFQPRQKLWKIALGQYYVEGEEERERL
jgi:hypothetical protein